MLFDKRDGLRLSFAVTALPVIPGLQAGAATLEQLNVETGELTITAERVVEVSVEPARILIQVLAR